MDGAIERAIQTCNGFYGNDQKEDLLHDFRLAETLFWLAKPTFCDRKIREVEKKLDDSSVLIVADWAMKFLQLHTLQRETMRLVCQTCFKLPCEYCYSSR